MFSIKNGQLIMYDINNDYKNYLRKYDNKVSTKNDRKFYGILVTQNSVDYCIPFTSRINKKTNTKFTINIKDNGQTVAKLLLNNMIPVNYCDCTIVNINNSKFKNYYLKEIQYLRKPNIINEIIKKTNSIYKIMNNTLDKDYPFLSSICCNFSLLEEKCKEWEEVQNILPILQYIKNENDLFYIYDELTDKNNFEKVVRILDNGTDSKDITNIDIKDFENKIIRSTTILNYMIDENTTIENFIKYNNEGNKLIPESGNIADVTLEELNNALEKEGYRKVELPNNIKVNDNTTLLDLQNILDKQNIKFKSNEEEM